MLVIRVCGSEGDAVLYAHGCLQWLRIQTVSTFIEIFEPVSEQSAEVDVADCSACMCCLFFHCKLG
jgi:hypothetical protein